MTIPGRKSVFRLYTVNKSYPIMDIMTTKDGEQPEVGKRILALHPFEQKKRAYVTPTRVEPLLRLFWDEGKIVQDLPSLEDQRSFVLDQLQTQRPDHVRLLNPTPYKVAVTQELHNFLHSIWMKEVPIAEL